MSLSTLSLSTVGVAICFRRLGILLLRCRDDLIAAGAEGQVYTVWLGEQSKRRKVVVKKPHISGIEALGDVFQVLIMHLFTHQ